jgi:hypothetical protein
MRVFPFTVFLAVEKNWGQFNNFGTRKVVIFFIFLDLKLIFDLIIKLGFLIYLLYRKILVSKYLKDNS